MYVPNRPEHLTIGGRAGAVAATVVALSIPNANPFQVLSEGLGGYFGGRVGGTLADLGDPPICGDHRGICHAVVPNAYLLKSVSPNLFQMQNWLREQAVAAELQMLEASTPLQALSCCLQSALWYIAAGAVVGVPVGHITHLLCDAGTARGLPLVVRRF